MVVKVVYNTGALKQSLKKKIDFLDVEWAMCFWYAGKKKKKVIRPS